MTYAYAAKLGLSAWLRKAADGGTASLHADYRKLSPEDDGVFPYMVMGPFDVNQKNYYREVSSSPLLVPSPSTPDEEKWEHYELRIPARTDLKGENGWYARVRVGAPTGGTVYVTDIRFHPVKSLAKSTYYSAKQRLPLVTLDENSKPGEIITCDGFGRPIKWEKARIVNNVFTGWVKLKEREYHLLFDLPEGVQLAFVGDVSDYIEVGKAKSLGWVGDKARKPNLYLSTNNGSNWEETTSKTEAATRQGSFTWSAPVYAAGKLCKLKMVDQNEIGVTYVSKSFEVGYNNRFDVGTEPIALTVLASPEGDGYYEVGDVVDITTPGTVDLLLFEYVFESWKITAGTGTFGDAKQRKTTFTISSFDAVDHAAIKAVYRKK